MASPYEVTVGIRPLRSGGEPATVSATSGDILDALLVQRGKAKHEAIALAEAAAGESTTGGPRGKGGKKKAAARMGYVKKGASRRAP
jgi:hypothetical protein